MFNKLNLATEKPVVWSSYTADILWTDTHISMQMLAYHLNPDISVASRTATFIDQSVDWLVSEFNLCNVSKVVDFGCGPGLYTHRFKSRGVGTVVGLDFSTNSLNYANQQANASNLEIEYRLGNYLDYNDSRKFDLICLVMCDFCALNPSQRSKLLIKFKSILEKDGVIALDVYTQSRFEKLDQALNLEKNSMNGFWSENEYWSIHSSFKYESEIVTLDKYVIVEDKRERTVYNWLQHFNIEMLTEEFSRHDLRIDAIYSDLKGSVFSDGDEMALIIKHK